MIKKHLTEKEYLNKEQYQLILYVVGRSRAPLTSEEIIDEMRAISSNNTKINQKSPMKDVHRKIKELTPFCYILDDRTFLFDYDKFSSDVQSHNDSTLTNIINVIKRYDKKGWLDFGWNQLDVDYKRGKYQLVDILEIAEREKNDPYIINYGSQKIVIDLNKRTYSYFSGQDKIFSIGLFILEKNNFKKVYRIEYERHSTIYLAPILNEDAKKNKYIAENYNGLRDYPETIITDPHNAPYIDLEGKERDEVKKILTDSKFWKYTLTFNGLLLYLLCESKKDYNQDSEKRIIEVLSNKELIENRSPFFQYWSDFHQVGFDVYSVIRKLCYDFETEILRDYKDKYFTAKIFDRCFNIVNNYFDLKSPLVLHNLRKYKENYRKYDIAKKLGEYNKMVLDYKESFLTDELKKVEKYSSILF